LMTDEVMTKDKEQHKLLTCYNCEATVLFYTAPADVHVWNKDDAFLIQK
jgi:hypothetical protein